MVHEVSSQVSYHMALNLCSPLPFLLQWFRLLIKEKFKICFSKGDNLILFQQGAENYIVTTCRMILISWMNDRDCLETRSKLVLWVSASYFFLSLWAYKMQHSIESAEAQLHSHGLRRDKSRRLHWDVWTTYPRHWAIQDDGILAQHQHGCWRLSRRPQIQSPGLLEIHALLLQLQGPGKSEVGFTSYWNGGRKVEWFLSNVWTTAVTRHTKQELIGKLSGLSCWRCISQCFPECQ